MVRRVIFMRHGQSEGNVYGRRTPENIYAKMPDSMIELTEHPKSTGFGCPGT